MYDANLVEIYQPIYDRIVKLVAESVADAEEIDSDLTADGSPLWHYTNHTVRSQAALRQSGPDHERDGLARDRARRRSDRAHRPRSRTDPTVFGRGAGRGLTSWRCRPVPHLWALRPLRPAATSERRKIASRRTWHRCANSVSVAAGVGSAETLSLTWDGAAPRSARTRPTPGVVVPPAVTDVRRQSDGRRNRAP